MVVHTWAVFKLVRYPRQHGRFLLPSVANLLSYVHHDDCTLGSIVDHCAAGVVTPATSAGVPGMNTPLLGNRFPGRISGGDRLLVELGLDTRLSRGDRPRFGMADISSSVGFDRIA